MGKKATDKVSNFFANYKVGVSVLGHGFSLEKIDRSVAIQDCFYKGADARLGGSQRGDEGDRLPSG